MNKIEVSIVIVNFNTKLLLNDCLVSIYECIRNIDFEVIIVDNASVDGSEDFIKQKFPLVRWINSGGNLGFGRANNIGAKYAKGKYLFFLNSDTILLNDAVSMFYDYMESNMQKESIGLIGSYLLDKDGNNNFSYSDFPSPESEFNYLWRKFRQKDYDVSDSNIDVDSISGANMFIPRDLFLKIGGFDSNIFMYYEETDLQYRLAKFGLKRRLIKGPRIIHLEGGSFKSKGLSLSRFIMSQTSYNYYIKKHFKGFKYIYYRMSLIFSRITIFFTTNWSTKEKMKAYFLVLRG